MIHFSTEIPEIHQMIPQCSLYEMEYEMLMLLHRVSSVSSSRITQAVDACRGSALDLVER